MLLFEKDSYLDLVCRGFDREYIKRMTGVDVGYYGCNVKSQLKGVNREQYKLVQRIVLLSLNGLIL